MSALYVDPARCFARSGHGLAAGSAVHGGLTVVVHRVDIRAEFQEHPHGFQHFGLRPGFFVGSECSEAGRRHEGRTVVHIRQEWIRARFDEQTHQGDVSPFGGHKKGGGSLFV